MLNPKAPPFDYGCASPHPVHGLQMGLSCSYPLLSTYASTPLPVVPYSSHSLHPHYHYHYLPQYLTPSNISCYTCFPPLLPPLPPPLPPPPLPDLPFFPFHQPRELELEEIDEGDGLVPGMADSESKSSVFHLSKSQSLPCFAGRRRRGGWKRSAACWVPKVDGELVVSNGHPIPERNSELKHDGRMRARRGYATAIAWVPKPKHFDVKEFEDDDEDRTTLMIKNIPNRFNRENLISMLDELCNHEEDSEENETYAYDFLYLPIDFQNRCNLGYAFVNFTTTGAALRLYKLLHKLKWEAFCTKKVCEITYARLQGKERLAEHFKGSIFPCDSDDYLPVVFSPPRDGSASCPEPKTIGKRKY